MVCGIYLDAHNTTSVNIVITRKKNPLDIDSICEFNDLDYLVEPMRINNADFDATIKRCLDDIQRHYSHVYKSMNAENRRKCRAFNESLRIEIDQYNKIHDTKRDYQLEMQVPAIIRHNENIVRYYPKLGFFKYIENSHIKLSELCMIIVRNFMMNIKI